MLRVICFISVFCMGCSLSPHSPLHKEHLRGDRVIYFEQADRVPKSVLIIPWAGGSTTNELFSRGIASSVIDGLKVVINDVSKSHGNERMENSIIQRRILIRGYSTNELEGVERIINILSGSIENWTPNNNDDGM